MRPTDILRFHGARSVTGTNTFDATIAAGDIIAAKIGYGAAGSKVIGTMPENGAINITPSSTSQPIPAGHTSGGSVAAVVVSVANVLAGTTIAGQAGTMVNNGAGGTVTPSTVNQTKAAGFWSSLITILGDPNLVANLIASGISIFGVAGTLIPYINVQSTASKSTTSGSPTKLKSITMSVGGNITIYFEMTSSSPGTYVCGQIYKNGAAIGSLNQTPNNTPIGMYPYDTTCAAGDVFDLYCYSTTAGSVMCNIQNFKIYNTIVTPTGGTATLN